MGIRKLKMGKISDRMRQDGAKMRKMAHVPTVLPPLWGVRHRPGRQQVGEPGPRGGDGEGLTLPKDWRRFWFRELIYTL